MTKPTMASDMLAKKQILYVEEQEDARVMLTLLLQRKGYQVATASTPAEALRLARLQWFDLYILESWLPDISGVELCQQLRAFDTQTPIIFYSGAAYSKDIAAGLAAGAQRYLTKPMDIYIIEEVIAGMLANAQSQTLPTYATSFA